MSASSCRRLADGLTVGRAVLGLPLILALVAGQGGLAWGLLLLGGLSDAADGWLARRFGGNALGAVLDPMADKALLVTMYVTLATVGVLPVWLAILVVFRDLLIVGGVIRVIPLTGVTLPFVSYGGSSLVANFVILGLLLRISDETALEAQDAAEREARVAEPVGSPT